MSVSLNSILILVFTLILATSAGARAKHKPATKAQPEQTATSGPKIWLADSQSLPVAHVSATASAQNIASQLAGGQGAPLSMINGDFDGDGIEDLVIGYATAAGGAIVLHRGNLDAFAPQSEATRQGIAYGQFPAPFLEQAQVFDVPSRPDFLASGDFTGNGRLDLAIASRGQSVLYILPNQGHGTFGAVQTVQLTGAITTLAAGRLYGPQSLTNLLVGLSGPGQASSLLVLGPTGPGLGLGAVANFPLLAPASNILFGYFGDPGQDAAFLSGGNVAILRSSLMKIETLSLPVTVEAMALGGFIYDRNPNVQLALLASDGSMHFAVHAEFDPRPFSAQELAAIRKAAVLRTRKNPLLPVQTFPTGWKIAESFPSVAMPNPAEPPILFRSRVSSNGADDVMVLNPASRQMAVVSHANVPGGASTFTPGQVSFRGYSGAPIAALPMRINIDNRPGVVAIHRGEVAPSLLMPIPDPTFFPNRFDDPAVPVDGSGNPNTATFCDNTSNTDTSSPCSLREAILKANATLGTDTIQLAAGTYTLSIAKVTGDFTGKFGTLEITDSLNLVGATDGSGNPVSIIQAGTTATNGVDKILSINEDITISSTASASLANLVLQFGFNRGDCCTFQDGFGGAFDFDVDNSGATVTVTNCILQNNSVHDGQGGGITVFNTGGNASTTGFLQISNSTIQNNSATPDSAGAAGDAGGLEIDFQARMVLNNVQILNNSANANAGTDATGGGIRIDGESGTSAPSAIHGGKIQGNTAAGDGGGILNEAGLTIDTEAVISGNTAGGDGGGIWNNNSSPDTTTLNKITITGNSATGSCTGCDGGSSGNGGGIFTGNNTGAQPLTMSFSRLAGNTARAAGSNLYNDHTTITAATDNWWGTNNPSSTITNANGGTTTFDPFIVLRHTASPQEIRINQSATLTGDMSQDNHGNALSLANLNVIVGLPITFNNPVLGTIPQAQPETLNSNTQAIATFNAGGTAGLGSAQATVDQAAVPVNSDLIASISEAGTTATVTTVGAHEFSTGQFVSISGVGVSGYNGQFFRILSTPTATTFTYTAASSGLGASSGGTATTGILILQPPSIAESFSPHTIQTTAGTGTTASTITFTITNGNAVPVDANFTDNLPTNVGTVPGSLVVAATPNIVNNCGGTVTATAGASTISFSYAAVPAGTCTVLVNVQSAVDNIYSNSVTIDSTDAGNGNTASDTLDVINPPHIVKSFAPSSIPFGATASLTTTVSNLNQNQTLTGISFTDIFPVGLVIATPSNLTSTCTGTATGTSGASSLSLSGAALAPGASCAVSVSVSGSVSVLNNSVTVNDSTAGAGNTSNATLTVTKANTTTTVTSSVNPSVFGQSVTFTATVSPVAPGAGTPTGTVTFLDGGSPIGTATLIGGIATFATSALAVGNHTITTNYGGDGNFNGSTGSLTGNPQVVNKANTATTVTSSANPSIFGQSVTFTATVFPVAPGSGTPVGTVTFLDGGSPIGTGTLSGSIATFTTSALAVGNHTITTVYGGDGNFNGSTGSLTGNPQVVNKADTSTTVASSQNPQTAGQPVTFTATVSAVAPGAGTSTGTVTFLDGGSPIGTGTLSGGVATFTTSALSAGSHTITTNYGGDGNFNGSTGSLTGNPQVITQSATTTTVLASQGTITLGDTVTFTATVTAASGTATGLVTFFDGNTPLGSGILNGTPGTDQATFSTSLLSAAGSPHSITATYQGATTFAGSISSPISEAVNPRTSTTGVALNPTTVVVGQSSAATVTLTDSGSVPPGTADTFLPTGAPATGRTGFAAGLFADGLVLVAGGTDANNNILNTAEIYSASNGTFSTTGNLNTARTGAITVLLPNGKMLVAGGSSDGTANGALNTAELFDPNAGTFSVAGSGSSNAMIAARFGATATLLNTGKVLLAGGVNSGGVLNSAELYDPAADTFTATGNLNAARTGASATLLGTGRVLVAGGSSDGTANGALNNAEVFDPAGNAGAGTFSPVAGANPTLAIGRWVPEAAVLLSGKVLIAGGQNSGGALTSADLYDPVADSFAPSNGNMSQARANGSAVALPSGIVLLAGGTTSQAVDLYDGDSDRFDTTGSLQQSDVGLVSELLNNGNVLVVGLTTAASPASDAELYTPSFNPLGTVLVTSSEATDAITGACTLVPSTSTASTCTSTVTAVNVATSPHTITGTYPADAVHSGSNSTASLTVNKADTTTTITASTPNPSAVNQAVTVTVQVTANAPGSGTPTGTVTVSDGAGQTCIVTLSSGGGNCSLTPTAAGTDTLTAAYPGDANFNGSTSGGVSQTVVAPPSIAKAFNPTSIAVNGATILTFTLTNPATNTVAEAGVAFTDALPAGLLVTTPNGLTNGCAGTATATAGGTSISLTGGNIAVSSSCTVVVSVSANVAGQFTNTSGAVSSTNGGTGNTATANLTVAGPPSIVKAFGPTSIPVNGTTTLTFTVTNPAGNTVAAAGVAFTDTLPAGLVVATPNGLTNSCGGIASATAGGTSLSLTGASLAVNTSCTVVGNVTGTTAGAFTNTSGPVSSTNGGTGNSATANLTVIAPPAITKAFNPTAIPLNGTTALTFTVTNPAANTVAETGVAFSDTLPAGLVISTPNGLTNSCGGTATATAGGTSISLTGGNIAVNSSCTVVVNVTGTTSGVFTNTTGVVSSTNGGTGNTASANLTVATPPAITKAFGAATIPLNGTTSLTFNINNPNAAVAFTGLAFTDNLPAGLVVAATPNLTNACGGTATGAAGASSVSLAGATLATHGSCSVSVNVTGATAGVKNNSVTVNSANAGTGNTSTASVTVATPPTLSKAFGAATIPLGGSTSLTFNVQNPNAAQTLTGIGFSDSLPAGLVVGTPNGLTGSCGGGTITATAGSGAVSLSGVSLAASASCTFSVNVIGTAAGQQNNTTGAITSNEGGNGAVASASITVVGPPVIAKAFNPAAITPNGTTSLAFTITNPAANTVALAGVAFTDTLPTGITVASSTASTCGGTLTTTAPTGIALTGATVAVNSQCQFSVTVTGGTPGVYTNTTGPVSSTNGGTGNAASASLTVATPATIAKAFGAASIGLGTSTSLTFTITNPNAISLTGVAFTDPLPSGLTVASPNGLNGACGAGSVTAAAGSTSISLTGGTIAATGSCTFSVNVTAIAAGNQVNTTGPVTATNGGTGNSATASINVPAPDLTVAKTHSGSFFQGQTGAAYTVIVSNAGQGPTAGTVTVTEVPPAGLTLTAMNGTGWTCTVTNASCTRADALAAGSAYPAITVTVNVATNAPASVTNLVSVAGGGELNLANDTATDVTTITPPPDFTLAIAPPTVTVHAGQNATYTVTIAPLNNAFTSPITLTAIGLPSKSQFTLTSPVTPGANPATATLVIMTAAGDPFLARSTEKRGAPLYATLFPMLGLLLTGLGSLRREWRKGKTGVVLLLLMLLCCGMGVGGCASAGNFRHLGTPPGTYPITVTATAGNLQHTTSATLVVQP